MLWSASLPYPLGRRGQKDTMNEIKDYPDEELDESEYKHFSGAIIAIAMIAMCALILMFSIVGVIR